MRRTEEALAVWRQAARELERAAEALLSDPASADLRARYQEAELREADARREYHTNIDRVVAERRQG